MNSAILRCVVLGLEPLTTPPFHVVPTYSLGVYGQVMCPIYQSQERSRPYSLRNVVMVSGLFYYR